MVLDILRNYYPTFLGGVWLTLVLTVISFTVALILGSLLAVMRISPVTPLRIGAVAYIGLMRCIPLLAFVVLFVFGLPKLGFLYTINTSVIVVLSLYTAGFVAETMRAGIRTVPSGEVEAARALGLPFRQVIALVVLPQAVRTIIPPLGNLAISQIKATAIAAAVGVQEITGVATRVNFQTAQPLIVFAIAAVAYLVLALPSGWALNSLESRLAVRR